ncbi:MAG TPA: hypothetical protein VLF19_08035, partial [Methylomirabilota bacterium]|nr:hypothetical protein [Methylomirabilota bacterium]
VVASLRETFSVEKFEAFLAERAADHAAREERRAERARLLDVVLPDLRTQAAKLVKRIAMVEDDSLVADLQAAYKEIKGQIEAGEARVLDLEMYETQAKDQTEAIEKLREVWGSWSGAFDAVSGEMVKARSILKKILVDRIKVTPTDDGWTFYGTSDYEASCRAASGGRRSRRSTTRPASRPAASPGRTSARSARST